MLTLAGIDIGTNTLRLIIARFSSDGQYRQMESARHITRLGEDICWTGMLKKEAMERAIGVLEGFSRACSKYQLDGIYAVATSAVREAANGADFIKMAKERTGIDVEVISGDEEARLTMLGAASGVDIKGRDIFLMDIGGGSTEFISASGEKILYKVSTDIGVVRFTEQYLHSDPPEEEEMASLESAIEERLSSLALFDNLRHADDKTSFIGTAGTVTTLAAIDQEMTVYDADRINGYCISRDRIREICNMLSDVSIEERRNIPGIEKGREDIILTGAVVVDKVMEWFKFKDIIVCDSGLREGLVIDLYNRLSGI